MEYRNPLISVIVPIYMIDCYVGLCIESILNQTYHNIEVILVDDGSKDRCAELCDLYAAKDSRIKVVHKPNGGLVSARKAGLRESNGEFISYVDGDDWVNPDFIECLCRTAMETGADIVCAGQSRDLFNQSKCFTNAYPLGIYEKDELKELWKNMISYGRFYRPGITTYLWNKLFRRAVLFESQMLVDNRISIGEDAAVTYPALLKCQKVSIIGNTDYHYRQREDSMLKQSASSADEAQRLRYLYQYMMQWSSEHPDESNAYELKRQIVDYVLSICIIRSGGSLTQDGCSAFGRICYGRNVVLYSAGTFGQQLVRRFQKTDSFHIVGWIDEDYWEYRRCCLDVDSVDSILKKRFDYVLIATVDEHLAERMQKKLVDFGIAEEKILIPSVPAEFTEREQLVQRFFSEEILQLSKSEKRQKVYLHA